MLDRDGLDGMFVWESSVITEIPSVVVDSVVLEIDTQMLGDGPTLIRPYVPAPVPVPVPVRRRRWIAGVMALGAAAAMVIAYASVNVNANVNVRAAVGGGPLTPIKETAPTEPLVTPIDPAVVFPGHFSFNDLAPSRLDDAELAAFVDQVRARCGEHGVVITGHTCWLGHERDNRRIGLDRARAVERLLELHGLTRVRAATAGSKEPIASNRTEEGRRANRRVTVSCDTTPEGR